MQADNAADRITDLVLLLFLAVTIFTFYIVVEGLLHGFPVKL